MFTSLRSKIFGLFVVTLLLVLLSILFLVNQTTFNHTFTQIKLQLTSGYRVFSNELDTQIQYKTFLTQIIAKDFGLIGEVAQASSDRQDNQSLQVALENFRLRSQADLAMILSPEHQLLSVTEQINLQQVPNNLLEKLHTEDYDPSQASHITTINNNIYVTIAVPIYAPNPNLIGWLVMGFILDDSYAQKIARLTELDVSFYDFSNNQGKLYASTIPPSARSKWDVLSLQTSDLVTIYNTDQGDFLVYLAPIEAQTTGNVKVLLQRSLTEALEEFDLLRWQLIAIIIAGLFLAAILAFIIAATVTKPLAQMIAYIRQISMGNYNADAPAQLSGEVGILFNEFSTMQYQIAQREADITKLAYFDPLTELPNRNNFLRTLKQRIEVANSASHITVLVMDLDNFKDINDTLSHVSGDLLLNQIAQRLQSACRETDEIARLGGDEFAILLCEVDRHQVIPVTKQYQQILESPFNVEGIQLYVNATIGIAIFPEHGENSLSLLQHAEVAMYVGKEQQLPYCLYNIQQDRHSLLRLTLMGELLGAIERNELTLYFQPKLALSDRQVIAVECLVRWIHPEHGFIPPDDFIPLAEQTGNIRFLTDWVLKQALHQCKQWRDLGIDLIMAVNISAMDLQQPSFPQTVAELLKTYQLPTQALVLEVTESSIMHDTQKAVAMLSSIYDMGVHLSIDDYGTGYSSMAQLKHLPVQELKIDKSFVQELANNKDDAIIVRSTIELGHNMGLKIVAEGVEDLEALELLAKWGCNTVQGYFISKPLPAGDFVEWLAISNYWEKNIHNESHLAS